MMDVNAEDMNMGLLEISAELSGGAIFVKRGAVNPESIIFAGKHPGTIVLCDGNPRDVVMVIPPQIMDAYGFVAGLASENP